MFCLRTITAACVALVIFSANAQQRPTGNTGTWFYVSGARIYDANSNAFIPLGFNSTVFWGGNGDCKKANLGAAIPKTGANTVRLITVTESSANSWSWSAKPSVQRELVKLCVDNQLVPMLEMHDATCDGNIAPVVAYWKTSAMVTLCKDYEKYLWVNIANEHNYSTPELWRDEYIKIIKELRAAGIKNLIVVDAGKNCGQNPDGIIQYGQAVIDGDPQKNVVLSIHMYGFWKTDAPASWQFKVQDKLKAMADKKLPVIVGEFGWDEPAGGTVPYDPRIVVSTCKTLGMGWYFWAFFDGDTKPYYGIVNNVCTGYKADSDLTSAGKYLVPYLKQNAAVASVFTPTVTIAENRAWPRRMIPEVTRIGLDENATAYTLRGTRAALKSKKSISPGVYVHAAPRSRRLVYMR